MPAPKDYQVEKALQSESQEHALVDGAALCLKTLGFHLLASPSDHHLQAEYRGKGRHHPLSHAERITLSLQSQNGNRTLLLHATLAKQPLRVTIGLVILSLYFPASFIGLFFPMGTGGMAVPAGGWLLVGLLVTVSPFLPWIFYQQHRKRQRQEFAGALEHLAENLVKLPSRKA